MESGCIHDEFKNVLKRISQEIIKIKWEKDFKPSEDMPLGKMIELQENEKIELFKAIERIPSCDITGGK